VTHPGTSDSVDLRAIGVVAIGRNEGERLRRCLVSLPRGLAAVVYVDSGSTDGSVELARGLGAEVVELDLSTPFTAARARNAGIARLRALRPDARMVQVIDGDCELVEGFVPEAARVLAADARCAVVCGRRRELFPEASVYNRLCDMEWNTVVGETTTCGGDALLRLSAFDAVGGYDSTLIAGEEPDLCARMRRAGYRILRIDAEMTRHDAALTRFDQWWKRTRRAGHATAEASVRRPDDAWSRKQVRSNLAYGLALPALALGLAPVTLGASLWLLGLHGVAWTRMRQNRMQVHGDGARDAALYAHYGVLGKLPQALGVVQFHANRLRGKKSALIEYKRT
jgi:glycosyltransferase involved in cell wall biosynthesis